MSHDTSPTPATLGRGDALLRAEGLRLHIGARVLVQDLGFEVRHGEFWVILGANGSGKTTLLNAVADLRRPQAGRLLLAGRDRRDWRPAEAARLCGYLPQGGDGLYGVSALQAVLLGRHPHRAGRLWETGEDIALAHAALARVDLAALAGRDIGTLSGGERQRVAAAALLAQDPGLYLLDEPLNHLDLRHQVALMDLLQAQTREHGRAVLATIHDLTLAARYATHAILMPAPDDAQAHALAGPAAEVLQPAALSRAFGHPVRRLSQDGLCVFVPA
jgi:iron complex transport system ATP-binding protein